MKNIKVLFFISVLIVMTLSQSCEKEQALLESSSIEQSEDNKTTKSRRRIAEGCSLSPIVTSVYHDLLVSQPLADQLNNYWDCNYPLQPAGDCCSPAYIDLGVYTQTPGGIEDWGPGGIFDQDYLSDGVLSESEQQSLINYAIDIANSNAPLCTDSNGNVTGQLVLSHIDFGLSPTHTSGGVVISATATYVPVCYSILFFQP